MQRQFLLLPVARRVYDYRLMIWGINNFSNPLVSSLVELADRMIGGLSGRLGPIRVAIAIGAIKMESKNYNREDRDELDL